jgi:hypothetical protein
VQRLFGNRGFDCAHPVVCHCAKEAYSYGKRGLFIWQKRPIHMAKETYSYGKRDLVLWQMRTRTNTYKSIQRSLLLLPAQLRLAHCRCVPQLPRASQVPHRPLWRPRPDLPVPADRQLVGCPVTNYLRTLCFATACSRAPDCGGRARKQDERARR